MSTRIELVLRVSILSNGRELHRELIQGAGSMDLMGACAAGQEAITEAAGKAVRRLGKQYVYKFVNSGVLR